MDKVSGPLNRERSKGFYSMLIFLTEGEAKNIAQSHPSEGLKAWTALHDRWNKRTSMGFTMIAEKIRSVPACKSIGDVLSTLVTLERLYIEYDDAVIHSSTPTYDDVAKKADLLKIIPKELSSKLYMDVNDMDKTTHRDLLTKVTNYVRGMTAAGMKVDLGSMENTSTSGQPPAASGNDQNKSAGSTEGYWCDDGLYYKGN